MQEIENIRGALMVASAQPGTCFRSRNEGFVKAALAKHEVRVTVFFEEAGRSKVLYRLGRGRRG